MFRLLVEKQARAALTAFPETASGITSKQSDPITPCLSMFPYEWCIHIGAAVTIELPVGSHFLDLV